MLRPLFWFEIYENTRDELKYRFIEVNWYQFVALVDLHAIMLINIMIIQLESNFRCSSSSSKQT